MAEERVQKILASLGYGSRRACEEIISAGRVSINGKRIKLGDRADIERDTIQVDGVKIKKKVIQKVYVALNKPKGVLSDKDPEDPRQTIFDLVNLPGNVFAVGRLDINSEGLVLITNDGELANRLTHPRYEHEKEYRVRLMPEPDDERLAIWRRGVVLPEGIKTAPAKVFVESRGAEGAWVRIIMHEGRKRQIREVAKTLGLRVDRLIRVRIETVTLGSLKSGESRHLSQTEINTLKKAAGLGKKD